MAERRLIVEVVGNSSNFERSMTRSSASANRFEHDLGKTTRGALAGSGAFKAMGRSLAFASGGFLAFAGVSQFLTKSVGAAEEAEKATAALATAQDHAKGSAKLSEQETSKWALAQARFGVSAATATQGLARLTIFAGGARKAMAGYQTALEISRATGKDLDAVVLAVGKALQGQTTALARYIGTIKKGTTAQELFARVHAKFGGQAEANTLASDKFNATLQNTEQLVGQGILPTLNVYLGQLTKWLQKMNESGQFQRDSAKATKDLVGILKTAVGVVKDIDKVTGSFKHTLELLIALKVASTLAGWTRAYEEFAAVSAANSAAGVGVVGKLTSSITKLARIGILSLGFRFPTLADNISKVARLSFLLKSMATLSGIAIGVAITYTITRHFIDQSPNGFFGRQGQKAASDPHSILGLLFGNQNHATDQAPSAAQFSAAFKKAASGAQHGQTVENIKVALQANPLLTKSDINAIIAYVERGANSAAYDAGVEIATARAEAVSKGLDKGLGTKHPINISAKLRNTFFDNLISHILLQGGLGDINHQIAGLEKADALLTKQIAKVKDVTRKRNLLDQLDTNEFQIEQLRAQQRTAALQKATAAAAARSSARNSRQFRELGLTGQGDNVVPGKSRLSKELGTIDQSVKGTIFDTPALESKLKKIRKVLSEPLIGRDVRSKIQDTLSGIRKDLDNFNNNDLTRFRHQSATNFVKSFEAATGISLSPDQVKRATALFSERGANGSVPGAGSSAFALAGGQTTLHATLTLDGHQVAKSVTKRQVKHSKKRSQPRGV